MEVSGQLHVPVALAPRKRSDRRLGRPQSWFGRGGEEKHFLPCLCVESDLGMRNINVQFLGYFHTAIALNVQIS